MGPAHRGHAGVTELDAISVPIRRGAVFPVIWGNPAFVADNIVGTGDNVGVVLVSSSRG